MKEKDAISESLRAYVAKYPSQTKAAGSLKGVSVGTVSNILNGRYENISDEMFRNVASQVGGVSATGWQIVETGAYQEITAVPPPVFTSRIIRRFSISSALRT